MNVRRKDEDRFAVRSLKLSFAALFTQPSEMRLLPVHKKLSVGKGFCRYNCSSPMLSHMIRFFSSGFLPANIETDASADNQKTAYSGSQTDGLTKNQ